MIAFAYCDAGPKMTAMYGALIDGLVRNVKEIMPHQEIMLITDDHTRMMKGVNHVLRIPRTVPLMTWRLKCHQLAHERFDEIVFVEPDVRFQADVMPEFDGDFDVALTTREPVVALDNDRINTKFTLGMTFSRNGEFWRKAKLHCQTLNQEEQDWFGDMISVGHVIEHCGFGVKMLDGAIYNHVVNDPNSDTDAKVLHYKGKRKAWLFPVAVEA